MTRRYQPDAEAYTRAAAVLDLPPSAVLLVTAHDDDPAAARAAGLATGFVPRPAEHGPGQRTDLTATADWDVVAADLVELTGLIQENSAL